MTPQRRKNTYKLSPIQEGLLFHDANAKNSGIGQIVCSINEPIDVERLKSAWRRAIDRHEALRTSFHGHSGEESYQSVQRDVALPWNAHDLRTLSGAQQESEFNQWLSEDREARFQLDRAPLFRLNLFRLGEEKWTLVWTFQPGLLDSRSCPIVLTEVFRTYDAARRSEMLDFPAVRPYSDYIQFLDSLDLSQAEKYWRKTLRGFAAATPLAVLEGHGGEQGHGEEQVQLPATLTQALEELALRERFTVNNAVQAAWAIALSRSNGTADVVFGAMRPCRGFLPRAGSMVGTFTNTLPVRVRMPGVISVFELLRQIRASEIAIRDYEHTPLTRIQSWSELPPTSALFQSVLVFDHAPLNSQMKSPYLNWTNRQVHLREHTNCPVTLYAYAEPALTLRLAYDRSRFGQGEIRQALGHLEIILKDIATGVDKNVGDLQSPMDQERRVEVWNATQIECPQNDRIQERIEEPEQPHPDTAFCALPQMEQAAVPATEDTSEDKAAATPAELANDQPPADHALWNFLREKFPPVSLPNVPMPVDAVPLEPALKVERSSPRVSVPNVHVLMDALPLTPVFKAERNSPPVGVPSVPVLVDSVPLTPVLKAERNSPPASFASAPVLVDSVPLTPVLKVEHNNSPASVPNEPVPVDAPLTPAFEVERICGPEPFAWATEAPKSAKRKKRTSVPVKNRRPLHTVLRELLKSAKNTVHPAARVKKGSAPASILTGFLMSDRSSQQPVEHLEGRRPLRDSRVEIHANSALATIQPNGTKPPIFCIDALDGDLNVFRTLSAGLGNDQPVYGLEPSGLKGDPAILTNVKKIAKYYVEQLCTAGQDQPYCLVGYSFGGLVALEMSQQLRARGAEVPATVLIDTHYAAGCRASEKLYDLMHRYKDHLQHVIKRDSAHSSTPGPVESLQVTTEISQIQQRASDRYRTRKYPGRACIFTASTPLPLFDAGPRNGWDKIFNDNLSIYYEIPGDRGIINTSKNAGLMVRRLKEFLGGVEESRVVPPLSRIAS